MNWKIEARQDITVLEFPIRGRSNAGRVADISPFYQAPFKDELPSKLELNAGSNSGKKQIGEDLYNGDW